MGLRILSAAMLRSQVLNIQKTSFLWKHFAFSVISRASVTGEGSAVVHVGSLPRPYRRHPMFRRLVKPGGGIGIHLGKPSLWVSKLIPGGWRLHKEPSVVPQNCDHPLVRLFSLVTSYARRLSRLHILILETLVCISH